MKKFFLLVLLGVLFAQGCIRVAGKTGVWYKSPDDEAAKSKQVGFDTQDLIPSGRTPGSIET